jgi:small subunit ribosomal protein S8
MAMTDPIADLLTRLRNATLVRHWEVRAPYSKLKEAIVKILQSEGFLESFEHDTAQHMLVMKLKQAPDGAPVLKTIRRISSPGRRYYVKRTDLPRVLNDYGVAIVSTSKGLMTNREARKRALGGEVLCEIS